MSGFSIVALLRYWKTPGPHRTRDGGRGAREGDRQGGGKAAPTSSSQHAQNELNFEKNMFCLSQLMNASCAARRVTQTSTIYNLCNHIHVFEFVSRFCFARSTTNRPTTTNAHHSIASRKKVENDANVVPTAVAKVHEIDPPHSRLLRMLISRNDEK